MQDADGSQNLESKKGPMSDPSVAIIIIAFCVAWYFLPTIIGFRRGISSPFMLMLVNGFFGWTVLGWIGCLIWATNGATKAQDQFFRDQMDKARQ
jgi:hypothetical protein